MKLKDDKKYRSIINALAERGLPNYTLAFKKQGVEYLRKLTAEFPEACYRYGRYLYDNFRKERGAEAYEYFKMGSDMGDVNCKFYQAVYEAANSIISKDDCYAVSQECAENSSLPALNALANSYMEMNDVDNEIRIRCQAYDAKYPKARTDDEKQFPEIISLLTEKNIHLFEKYASEELLKVIRIYKAIINNEKCDGNAESIFKAYEFSCSREILDYLIFNFGYIPAIEVVVNDYQFRWESEYERKVIKIGMDNNSPTCISSKLQKGSMTVKKAVQLIELAESGCNEACVAVCHLHDGSFWDYNPEIALKYVKKLMDCGLIGYSNDIKNVYISLAENSCQEAIETKDKIIEDYGGEPD